MADGDARVTRRHCLKTGLVQSHGWHGAVNQDGLGFDPKVQRILFCPTIHKTSHIYGISLRAAQRFYAMLHSHNTKLYSSGFNIQLYVKPLHKASAKASVH